MLRRHIALIVTTVVRDRLRELHHALGWVLTGLDIVTPQPASPVEPSPSGLTSFPSPDAEEYRERAIVALECASETVRQYSLCLDPHDGRFLAAHFVPEIDELRRRFTVGTSPLATPSAEVDA